MNTTFFKSILDQSPICYAYYKELFNPSGKPTPYQVLEMSPSFAQMLGTTSAELVGTMFSAEIDQVDGPKTTWQELLNQVDFGGEPFELDYYSSAEHCNYRIKIFSPEKGYMVTTATYSSDAQQQEATLTQQRAAELERFFTVNLDLLCIADSSGRFLRLNHSWEKVLGYPLQELEGAMFLDYVHPDDIEATLGAMATLDQQELIFNFTNRYRCKNGSYRYIEWRSHPYGNLMYGAARDITEKVLEKEHLEAIIQTSQEFLQLSANSELDYQNITDVLRKITDRKSTRLNSSHH